MLPPGWRDCVSTDSLIDSMTALLPKANFSKVLDPCCGSGKLVSVVSNQVSSEEAVGVDIVGNVVESATSTYPEIDFIQADSSEELDLSDDFDLVIGALPLGVRYGKRQITPEISTNNTSDVILYRSLLKLKPAGIGIFLAAHNFLIGKDSKTITNSLSSEGINPIGVFYVGNPLGERSGIPGVIIIFQRDEKRLSVIGKAPNGSEGFLPGLRNMVYDSGEEIEGYRRSVFGNLSSFTSDGEPIFADNKSNIESLRSRLNDIGTGIYEFDDVVISDSHTKPPNYDRLPHEENSIYLPKARGIVQVSQDDLSPKLKNYYQLVLDPLIAKDVYVMDTMHSELGKKIFDICASGVTIPQISKSGLKKMLFPLPSIEDQEEWVDISLEIKQKEADLVRLKHLLHKRTNISEIYDILEGDISGRPSLKELLSGNEDINLEFKASMWTRYKTVNKIATEEIVINPKKPPNFKDSVLEDEVLHTITAFLNTMGGTLLIGVKDKPNSWGRKPAEVFGIENDYSIMGRNKGADEYVRSVYEVLNRGFGDTSTASNVSVKIEQFGGKDICRIDVEPLPKIRDGQLFIIERSDIRKEKRFYVRIGSSSQRQSMESAVRYIRDNFPPPNDSASL